MTVDHTLKPGKYFVIVDCNIKGFNQAKDLVLSTYSTHPINMTKTPYINRALEMTLMSCAFKKSKRKYYTYENLYQSFTCFNLNDSGADYGYYYIHNDSALAFKEIVTFTKLQGYKLMPPHGGT